MKKILIAALIAAAGGFTALPGRAAPLLSIVPGATSIPVNGTVSVDLTISGLASVSQIVSGFDLDVFFNPAVLGAGILATPSTPWGVNSNDFLLDQRFIAPGHVEFVLTALRTDAELDALQGDGFTLSSISFTGLADGFSTVTFGADPDFERNVVGRNGLSLAQGVQGTCIAVGAGVCALAAVPEPSTAALLLLACAAGGAAVRRHRPVQLAA